MTVLTLVRQHDEPISEDELLVVRKVVFGIIDGLGDVNRKRWRRFWSGLRRLAPGEMVEVSTRKQRSGPFHRRHMAIEHRVFDSQERLDEFSVFRDWLKVGCGFCDWLPGARGGVFPIPRSIAYDQLEDDAMREFHEQAVAFLRSAHACKFLWPKLPAQQREAAMDSLLGEFGA